MPLPKPVAVATALALALCPIGCDDEDKVVVENVVQEGPNNPPLVVSFGPESPIENLTYFGTDGVNLWVLAGDPDGLDDISVAILKIDSIQLQRFIARPDTSTNGCLQFSYADTVATDPILPVPATFPGVDFLSMRREEGGLFTANGLGANFGYINLIDASPVLEQWPGGCGGGDYNVQGPMNVVPPAVPQTKTIIVTYMDVVYNGMKVTVYDKVGASAVATYPSFHVVYTTSKERDLLP
jgi:hypothetical protein